MLFNTDSTSHECSISTFNKTSIRLCLGISWYCWNASYLFILLGLAGNYPLQTRSRWWITSRMLQKECNDSKNRWPYKMTDHYWGNGEEYSGYCEQYPAFNADVVFRFDHKRVELSYYEKCGKTHKKSGEVHYHSFCINILLYSSQLNHWCPPEDVWYSCLYPLRLR